MPLEPFAIASRLVTSGEYLSFIEEGGYRRPELWLSDGWATVVTEGWTAPGYWRCIDGRSTISRSLVRSASVTRSTSPLYSAVTPRA